MKRWLYALAAVALTVAPRLAEAEPELYEAVATAPSGYIWPPFDPDDPDWGPVSVTVDENGKLVGDLTKYKDSGTQNAIQAMTMALNNRTDIDTLIQGMKELNAQVCKPGCTKCRGSGGGGAKLGGEGVEAVFGGSFDGETLTITAPKIGFGTTAFGSIIELVPKGTVEKTVTGFAKIAGTNKITDTDDWETEKSAIETAYTAADTQVKEDLTNLILSYHPPEGGVPDEATNILAKVAFDGDYNSLTNKPTIAVTETEGEEGEEASYQISLVPGGGEDEGSLSLAKIAITGKWNDLKDVPDKAATLVKGVEQVTEGLKVTSASYCVTTNGLEEVAGSSSSATIPITGGGGEGGGGQGGGCTCQIKTAADVYNAETDHVIEPRVAGLENRVTTLEEKVEARAGELVAVGAAATIGVRAADLE